MSDKNPIVSVGKAVLNAAKSLGQILVVYGRPSCHQCDAPVHPDFAFCSEACAFNYWKKCRDQYHKTSGDLANGFHYHHCCYLFLFFTSGQKVCGYPGCSKPCYRECGRTYDYCSKTHATELGTLQDWGQGRLQQHQPGSSHQGKHHHGNSHHGNSHHGNSHHGTSHHNHHQNTRTQSGTI